MDVKDMINHAYSKNATEFETAFNTVMADKVEAALGAKFDSMYGGEQLELDLEPQAEVEHEVDAAPEVELESEE